MNNIDESEMWLLESIDPSPDDSKPHDMRTTPRWQQVKDLMTANSRNEAKSKLRKKVTGLSIDQCIGPVFKYILENQPHLLDILYSELRPLLAGKCDDPDSIIRTYFTSSDATEPWSWRLAYQESIPDKNVRLRFTEKASELMFQFTKEYFTDKAS